MTSDRKRRLVQTSLLGAIVGLLLSQYRPLWGTPAQLKAEPWTATRKTLGGPHMLLFVGVGLAVGAAIIRARDE